MEKLFLRKIRILSCKRIACYPRETRHVPHAPSHKKNRSYICTKRGSRSDISSSISTDCLPKKKSSSTARVPRQRENEHRTSAIIRALDAPGCFRGQPNFWRGSIRIYGALAVGEPFVPLPFQSLVMKRLGDDKEGKSKGRKRKIIVAVGRSRGGWRRASNGNSGAGSRNEERHSFTPSLPLPFFLTTLQRVISLQGKIVIRQGVIGKTKRFALLIRLPWLGLYNLFLIISCQLQREKQRIVDLSPANRLVRRTLILSLKYRAQWAHRVIAIVAPGSTVKPIERDPASNEG